MSWGAALGGLASGVARGVMVKDAKDAKDARVAQAETGGSGQDARSIFDPNNLFSGGGGGAGGDPTASGLANDPMASDLDPTQRAFLNAVASGESGGKYNIRYTPGGGTTFGDFSRHPGVFEPGPAGPSSAAGRYQFTKTTWDDLGGGSFDPVNQDRQAWRLADRDYGARTGRKLAVDLQERGLTTDILGVLAPTWTSFKTNQEQRINAYRASLARYSEGSS